MSKIWLLLLFVGALQFVHSFPAEYELDDNKYFDDEHLDEYSSDEEQSTWGILKETWNKLKDEYTKITKEKMKQIISKLQANVCDQQNDFKEKLEEDESQDSITARYKIVQKMKEIYEKAKIKWGSQKQKFKEAVQQIKSKFCAKLNDVALESDFYDDEETGDEERGWKSSLSKFAKKTGDAIAKGAKTASKAVAKGAKTAGKSMAKGAKTAGKSIAKGAKTAGKAAVKAGKKMGRALKKIKGPMKEAMKKGAKILKNLGVKINPLQCEEKTCRSCIEFRLPIEKSFCVEMRFMKTNLATYLVIAITEDRQSKHEKKIKIGEMSNCLDIGNPVGRICLQGIEARAKSSEGKPHVNFCLVILAERFGIGVKICATYIDKKLKVDFDPQTFPGGTSEDGSIVTLDETGEEGQEVGTEEFEVD